MVSISPEQSPVQVDVYKISFIVVVEALAKHTTVGVSYDVNVEVPLFV